MISIKPQLFALALLATAAACTVPKKTDETVTINGKDYAVWIVTKSKAFGSADAPGDITFESLHISHHGERILCEVKDIQACLPIWQQGIEDVNEALANQSESDSSGDSAGSSGGGGGGGGGTDL
ncbi:hypothetical protein NBRC116601_08750 [Cognatishimia sp. WU-CL00825]|uniref:hypothetical protein n=1 Tax=Cognatishimia sp. WU-CL00825 TaxID=3127658 RepID=UPI0031042D06